MSDLCRAWCAKRLIAFMITIHPGSDQEVEQTASDAIPLLLQASMIKYGKRIFFLCPLN